MGKGESKHQEQPVEFAIKRTRNGDEHIKSCNSGYTRTKSKRYRQVHHIIPISSVADSTIFEMLGENVDDFLLIRNCLALTEWNINAAGNVISLPIKRAFIDRAASSWNGYPCHQVDHNPHYTDAVSRDLTDNVWKPQLKAAEACSFDGESLAAELGDASDDWRDFLVTRGGSNGGTAFCWRNRLRIDRGELKAPGNKPWFYPFSMHPGTPTKRKPPPDWDDFSGSMKEYLKQLFQSM